ncbi:MAG: nucleotidyltransferase [Sandaracinaceae bacterium]|nr:MAG: nucleotidyltransferase [Sandaracinaceae bacterium]
MSDRKAQLSVFLDLLGAELDVPEHVDRELRAAYDDLAEFLREDPLRAGAEVYPQGSRRIGTMIRPVKEDDDYDVDLVFRRNILKTSTTQQRLKEWVGEQLRAFVELKRKRRPATAPTLSEGSRCWTLTYPSGFHLDVLPAIPNDGPSPTDSILITDREVRLWQVSNPRGYANWFRARSERSFLAERARLAKSRGVEIEAIPEDDVKTPLHRAVQLLKRHRDIRFDGPSDDKPASILITTLAGLAYAHGDSLYAAIGHVFGHLLEGIEEHDGVIWVGNPVDPEENFADRWRAHPERAQSFLRWARDAKADFERAGLAPGLDEVAKSLGAAFGVGAAKRAAVRLGEAARTQRERGSLRISSSGTLGRSGSRPVKDHTFYGS